MAQNHRRSFLETRGAAPIPSLGQDPANLNALVSRIRGAAIGFLLVFAVLVLAFYLFMCFCYKRICENAGEEPGVLVWIPLLQFVPLLRVAELPVWTIILFFVPFVNLVFPFVMWAKICAALDKSPWLAAILLLPILNLLLIPYLAFSSSAPSVPLEEGELVPQT